MSGEQTDVTVERHAFASGRFQQSSEKCPEIHAAAGDGRQKNCRWRCVNHSLRQAGKKLSKPAPDGLPVAHNASISRFHLSAPIV
ncbi:MULTISPECIES: hypothetical protein [unclassified Mesorhizobium]|uniref:hypothetical protein n=1 Tax=unclassified Mesorhizobium TaxID=325217 RepID=UPI0011708351|nr:MULTISPECIES: hypothetical protein [unclassified Mesorhizobium]MBZ9983928.1 hypothetical protein [Mesorhizobium sp. BR-1-1-8]TPL36852.1 hypothetical protein FJ947_11475 [Mesorhizobium sp. B2-4-8]